MSAINIPMKDEPISTDDCIRKMYEAVITGNGAPPLILRMDRVERSIGIDKEETTIISQIKEMKGDLNLIVKLFTLFFAPVIVAILLGGLGFIWALWTHQIAIYQLP